MTPPQKSQDFKKNLEFTSNYHTDGNYVMSAYKCYHSALHNIMCRRPEFESGSDPDPSNLTNSSLKGAYKTILKKIYAIKHSITRLIFILTKKETYFKLSFYFTFANFSFSQYRAFCSPVHCYKRSQEQHTNIQNSLTNFIFLNTFSSTPVQCPTIAKLSQSNVYNLIYRGTFDQSA